MMCSNAEDLRRRAEWDGAKGTSRQKLLAEIQSIYTYYYYYLKKKYHLFFQMFNELNF